MEDPVIENLKTICLCKNIKKGTILNAIHGGYHTVEAVNRKLGTGSGDCKGERCGPKIKEMIESLLDIAL
ncbi:MAG: (2Fe-2S)-binding protein [Deltaproteobacteria bacterium]|nr:(2Fe-2S)-binding protein [Deltaproteobacteria bacterium]